MSAPQLPRTFPVALADRPWAPAVTAATVGPLVVPPRDALVAAVERLARELPHGRVGWTLEGSRWRFDPDRLAALAESMVHDRSEDPAQDYAGFANAVARDEHLAWPIAVVRAPDHVAVRVSHASGDGRLVAALLAAVVRVASGGELPSWPAEISHAYARASATFLRERPVRALAAARAVRPALGARDGRSTVPWAPARETVYARLEPAAFDEVRRWRKQHVPGTSGPALELGLVLRALAAAALPVRPEVLVLFDLRRYLPTGAHVQGNFVVGVALPLSASTPLPTISALIARANEVGRPLTAFGANLALRRSAGSPPDQVGQPPSIQVAFTHLGRPREIERLPWLPGAHPTWTGSVEPAGPEGLTVAVTETGRALHLNVSFHGNVLDRADVEQAMTLLCADPIGLLVGSVPVAA